MSQSDDRLFSRLSTAILGPIGTSIFGFIFIGLGWATFDSPPPDLPARDGIAILCFASASAAFGSVLIYRDRMSIAHEIMGMTLMIVSALRGVTYGVTILNSELDPGVVGVLSGFTAPWIWAVVFSSGMLLWAYGRRESIVRQIRDAERKG